MRRVMVSRFGSAILCTAAIAALLSTPACDPTTSGPDPMRARYGDPPVVYTFLNGVTGQQTAVRIEFPSYTTKANVTNPAGFTFLRQGAGVFGFQLTPQAATRRPLGQGAQPPDPDEFNFDPWDIPEPPNPFDDPFPDFPDPFDEIPPPPDPFDDPFNDFPDPPLDLPPLPGGDLPNSNYSPGTVNITNTGGQQTGSGAQPQPQASSVRKPKAVTLIATIQVGPSPGWIANSPDRKTLYVAVGGNGTIAVIDRTTNTVASRITLPSGAQPYALAITPDGSRLYTGELAPSPASIYSVDLPGGAVKKLGVSGSYISQAIVTPDGTQVWICSYFGNVQIFDVLTNTYITALPISNPWNVAFNPSGTRAYITNGPAGVQGSVAVVDTATLQTIASIPVGLTPRAVRVTPSGRHVFVTNYDSTFVNQIDTAANTVIRSIDVGGAGASGIGFAHN
jgi:YVTN family beta-propeller protein